MEDHRKSRTDSTESGDEKIVELTQEMELSDQKDGDIIDLTNSVDNPDGMPVETTPAPPEIEARIPAEPAPSAIVSDPPISIEKTEATPAPSEIEARIPAEPAPPDIVSDPPKSTEEAEATPAPPEIETEIPVEPAPPDSVSDSPKDIEEEVDAAFETVQAPYPEDIPEEAPDAQLFDNLSDIPDKVDNAVNEYDSRQSIEIESTDISEPEPDIPDEASLAADAAVFEAAMGTDSAEEEILDLTDVVDPADIEPAMDPLDEDEVIELTDIVDPAELAHLPITESEDEEILDLTDIVDPLEFTEPAEEDDEILVLTDIVDPADIESSEEEDLIDTFDDIPLPEPVLDEPDMLASEETETVWEQEDPDPAALESDEIADLFAEEMSLDDPVIEDMPSLPAEDFDTPLPDTDEIDEEQEQVIQLSDVLGKPEKEERLPIEKIKLGAEEDLAAQPISLEREDTANVMGLNLEEPATEEEKSIQDRKIEAAVEHILQTKYAETIDRLIANAVEKAVKQEMAAIKRSLGDEDSEA